MTPSSKLILCPYCGHTQTVPERCEECGGLFEPLSRRATQIAMGPWFIRDKENPFRPGCSFDVIRKLVDAGKIKPTTVLRGPTTRQFWSVARNVPGVAHLLGYCHQCNEHVSQSDKRCPACRTSFDLPDERNELGLMYPTALDAAAAQRALETERQRVQAGLTPATEMSLSAVAGGSIGMGLLAEVLETGPAEKPRSRRGSRLLRMEESDPPAAAEPTRAASVSGQSSRASNPAADEEDDTAPLPKAGPGLSLTTWLLIAGNVLFMAMIVWMVMRQGNANAPAPRPVAPASLAPRDPAPVEPAQAPPQALPPQTESNPPGEATSVAASASLPPAAPAVQPPAPRLDPPREHPVHRLLREARELHEQGRLTDELAKLREVRRIAKPEELPVGLDESIAQLEKQIKSPGKTDFFGISE